MARYTTTDQVKPKRGPVCLDCSRKHWGARYLLFPWPRDKTEWVLKEYGTCQICSAPTLWEWGGEKPKPNIIDFSDRPRKQKQEKPTEGFTEDPNAHDE